MAVAADVLHGPTPGRNNSSASEAAMAVRNGRNAAAHSRSVLRSNVLLSSRGRRSSNRDHRQQKESGRDAVAAVAAAANQQSPVCPTRTRRRSNSRGRRASHVPRVPPRPRARILSPLARMAEHPAPRATVQNGGDASGVAAAVGVVVADPRRRRRSGGCAALSVVGLSVIG